ncbi:MAG: hypothetical protein K6F32_03390, partial [Bacilli bacterium]|nr:hypothetical protein [Bacilli bacterium]
MKKKLNLLVLSSALMLGLASCGGGETASSSVADSGTAETSSVASAETDYVAYAEAAYASISATYDDWAKGIATNQKIYLKATYGGVEFTVSYTISEAAKAYLSISGEELVVTTDSEDHALAGAVTVTLSYNGNTYYSKALNVKVS